MITMFLWLAMAVSGGIFSGVLLFSGLQAVMEKECSEES